MNTIACRPTGQCPSHPCARMLPGQASSAGKASLEHGRKGGRRSQPARPARKAALKPPIPSIYNRKPTLGGLRAASSAAPRAGLTGGPYGRPHGRALRVASRVVPGASPVGRPHGPTLPHKKPCDLASGASGSPCEWRSCGCLGWPQSSCQDLHLCMSPSIR